VQSNVEYLPIVKGNISDVIESNKTNNWPDLHAQAKVFAHEFSIVGNLTKACKRVGIGREKGSRLLRDPLVDAYINDIQEACLTDSTIITRAFVELALLDQYEKANGEVEVPNVTKDGDVIMGKWWNGSVALGVIKEMKGLAGMNRELGVDGHGVTVQINMNDFTGAENIEKEVNVVID
jgi:hypothetical protein